MHRYLQSPVARALVLCLSLSLWPPCLAGSSYQTVVIGEVAQRDADRPIYEINLPELGEWETSDDPREGASGMTSMRMVTARGQVMRCMVPLPAKTSPTPPRVNDETRFDDIDDLLSEYEGKCFIRVDGWWTYEFCFGEHVVQKHIIPKDREPLEGEAEDSFVLGKMDRKLDLMRRRNGSEVSTKDAAFTQMFVNGTNCDTTNKPRRVLVKYLCRDDAVQLGGMSKKSSQSNLNLLKTVREVESCVYEVEFMNGAICQHRTYKEKLAHSARPIHCSMEEESGPFEGLSSITYKKASLNL